MSRATDGLQSGRRSIRQSVRRPADARLLTYLRPYQWHVAIALAAIILKSGLDVLGPFLTKIAIDKYLAKSPDSHSYSHSWIGDRLSDAPLVGIAQMAAYTSGFSSSRSSWSSFRPT